MGGGGAEGRGEFIWKMNLIDIFTVGIFENCKTEWSNLLIYAQTCSLLAENTNNNFWEIFFYLFPFMFAFFIKYVSWKDNEQAIFSYF